MDANAEHSIQLKYELLSDILDERGRRLWAALEARQFARGGVAMVSRATGLSRTTIYQGLEEWAQRQGPGSLRRERTRVPGGGRKPLITKDPQVSELLERLVDPVTRGDPESPLRWTLKSTRQLADVLTRQGHPVGRQKVSDCWAHWATVCRPIARREKVVITQTVTRSSPILTSRSWIISHAGNRRQCGPMISLIASWARSTPMGCTIPP